MRHRVAHRKLGRTTEHRTALLRNQAEALLRHERIETTVPKAKELRPFVERLITIAKRSLADGTEIRKLNARRLVLRDVPNEVVVEKLFDTIAPRFAGRLGGYTRLMRVGYRRGDSAEIAQVELVGSEYDPAASEKDSEAQASTRPKRTGMGGRIRAAADRLRGLGAKAEAASGDAENPAKAARAKKAKKTEE